MKHLHPLRFGGTSDESLEEIETDLLLQAVERQHGYDFRNYSRSCLRRCIRRSMADERIVTISALQERLLHDSASFYRFLGRLSVSVTAMFRDPPFYRALRDQVLPVLRTYPRIMVWHAGCSTGEEVYSFAILLTEAGLYDRCRIYATDLNEAFVERARSGVLEGESLHASAINYRDAGGTMDFLSYYRLGSRRAVLDRKLQRNIVFSRHSLVTDGSFNEFQLVLCRNVMIYFNHQLRHRAHGLIYDSLARFGILGLGSRESLQLTHFSALYEAVDAPTRLYRKIG